MYFLPVFSFSCAVDEENADQPCPESAVHLGVLQVFHGSGPPSGLQAGQNPLLAGIYYDDDSGAWYPWDIANQTWPTVPEVT